LNILHLCISAAAFDALMLLAGWLEGHLALKKTVLDAILDAQPKVSQH